MTSITSLCEMACKFVHKKLEEKQLEEEQAAKAQNWKLPVCYDDDDDEERSDSLDNNIISGLPSFSAITPSEPVLSTEEPDNSLSMGDEHLDTIPATKSDKFIKSSVEDLIPIPSESEGIPEHTCDVPSHDNYSPLDISKDQIEDLSDSEVMEIVIPEVGGIHDDILLMIKDDILLEKLLNVNLLIAKIKALNANPTPSSDCKTNSGSSTTPPDISLPEYEAFHDDHVKEISSGSPTTHSDSSLYASFIFDLSINPFPPADRNNPIEEVEVSKESELEPAKKRTSSKTRVKKKVTISAKDNIISDDLDTAGKSISQTKAKEAEATKKEKLLQQEQWAYLSTHPSKRLHSFYFDDDDDDEDYTFAITPNEPFLSTEEPDNSLTMRDEHIDTISVMESDEFIKSGVENLIPIPSESDSIPEHMCNVPSLDNSPPLDVFKDQFEDFSVSNEEFSSIDDDSFSIDDIDYVEASPPDSELTKSSSTSLNSLLEETNNFDNSLPEFTTFSKEEIIPMKSLRTHDSSLPISSKIDSLLYEFTGELTLLKLIPPGIDETDCDFEEDICLIEKLFYDNSSPRPSEEFISANSDAKIKSLSISYPRIVDKDYDSERDTLILKDLPSNNTLSFAEKESFHFDISSFSLPPAKPPDGDTGILNIKMMGDISDQKAFMHKLMITLASHQEKSPDLLSHRFVVGLGGGGSGSRWEVLEWTDQESKLHLFGACEAASSFWEAVFSWWGLTIPPLDTVKNILLAAFSMPLQPKSFITHRDLYNARLDDEFVVMDILINGVYDWPTEWKAKYAIRAQIQDVSIDPSKNWWTDGHKTVSNKGAKKDKPSTSPTANTRISGRDELLGVALKEMDYTMLMRDKLDHCAEKCVFIGYGYYYSPQHSGQEEEQGNPLSWLSYTSAATIGNEIQNHSTTSNEAPNISATPKHHVPDMISEVSSSQTNNLDNPQPDNLDNPQPDNLDENNADNIQDSTFEILQEHEEEVPRKYVLPPRSNRGVPPKRYSLEKPTRGAKYLMANIAEGNLSNNAKAFVVSLYSEEIPSSFEQALKLEKWKKAMDDEMKALKK
nr:ribonuclease H-like domain-containing protein [Tanacetum cinerariifolium]